MKYDAMNLGMSELAFGLNYLQEEAPNITFPFLSTNLTGENETPFLEKVILKDVGGARVAILGVMPDNFPLESRAGLENDVEKPGMVVVDIPDNNDPKTRIGHENNEALTVSPPIKVIKESITDVAKDSDFIILLSQLPRAQLHKLLDDVDGIDLVITCKYPKKGKLPEHEKTPSVRIKPSGTELGYLKIEKDNKGPAKIIEDRKIILDKSVPRNEETVALVDKFYRRKVKEERMLRQKRVIEKETKALMKLSPMEYLELLQKTEK